MECGVGLSSLLPVETTPYLCFYQRKCKGFTSPPCQQTKCCNTWSGTIPRDKLPETRNNHRRHVLSLKTGSNLAWEYVGKSKYWNKCSPPAGMEDAFTLVTMVAVVCKKQDMAPWVGIRQRDRGSLYSWCRIPLGRSESEEPNWKRVKLRRQSRIFPRQLMNNKAMEERFSLFFARYRQYKMCIIVGRHTGSRALHRHAVWSLDTVCCRVTDWTSSDWPHRSNTETRVHFCTHKQLHGSKNRIKLPSCSPHPHPTCYLSSQQNISEIKCLLRPFPPASTPMLSTHSHREHHPRRDTGQRVSLSHHHIRHPRIEHHRDLQRRLYRHRWRNHMLANIPPAHPKTIRRSKLHSPYSHRSDQSGRRRPSWGTYCRKRRVHRGGLPSQATPVRVVRWRSSDECHWTYTDTL